MEARRSVLPRNAPDWLRPQNVFAQDAESCEMGEFCHRDWGGTADDGKQRESSCPSCDGCCRCGTHLLPLQAIEENAGPEFEVDQREQMTGATGALGVG